MHASKSRLLAVGAIAALSILTAPVRAAETGADVPKNSYHNDPLTPSERSGIAQEENVSPSDGKMSVPSDPGVIPDAGDAADRNAVTETPAQNDAQDVERGAKGGEKEADAILDESKKDMKVTKRGLSDCLKDWDPQTQMTKEEWKDSCRTTLEYFPDGH